MANAIEIKQTLKIYSGVSGGIFLDTGKPMLVEPPERTIASNAIADGHIFRDQDISDGAVAIVTQTLAYGVNYLYLRVTDPVKLDFEQDSVARILHVCDELLIDLTGLNTYFMQSLTITATADATDIRAYWVGL